MRLSCGKVQALKAQHRFRTMMNVWAIPEPRPFPDGREISLQAADTTTMETTAIKLGDRVEVIHSTKTILRCCFQTHLMA
jgi:hypothetical protein